jgi:DNA uptake protein ComE-like DNA-binding protein
VALVAGRILIGLTCRSNIVTGAGARHDRLHARHRTTRDSRPTLRRPAPRAATAASAEAPLQINRASTADLQRLPGSDRCSPAASSPSAMPKARSIA